MSTTRKALDAIVDLLGANTYFKNVKATLLEATEVQNRPGKASEKYPWVCVFPGGHAADGFIGNQQRDEGIFPVIMVRYVTSDSIDNVGQETADAMDQIEASLFNATASARYCTDDISLDTIELTPAIHDIKDVNIGS